MIDTLGLYVETDGDGGDCPNRTGIMLCHASFNGMLVEPIVHAIDDHLHVGNDQYIRYPVKWNDPKDFSRDQASQLMLGFLTSTYGMYAKAYYKICLKNFGRHPNGDLVAPGEVANIIRGLKAWYLYPLLLILDLKFLGDLIARKYSPWGYDALLLPSLYFASRKYRTPGGFLARLLYKRSDAMQQIYNNLINPATNGCVEAGAALQEMFKAL